MGVPIDRQLDPYYVSGWKLKGVDADEPQEWIQFVNKTIEEDGIRFKLTPSIEQVRQNYEVQFNLTDLNPEDPKTQVYEFTIKVLEASNFNFTQEFTTQSEQEKEVLNVDIEPLDDEGWRFMLNFSQRIFIPANYTSWTNENEGNEKL